MEQQSKGLYTSIYAALALAFASLGDAFLYPFLPVNNLSVGVPVFWIGILLSINRFVRIISNRIMVDFFARFGLRLVMIVAVLVAIVSTAGYALASGVYIWLVLRICWGLSFSAMRIGTLGYALHQRTPGLAIGVSKGIQDIGPMLSLLLAPVLLMYFEPRMIFILLAIFSLPAIYFSFRLPVTNDRTYPVKSKRLLSNPSTFNLITFVSAIVMDGIVIVVLGVLFLEFNKNISLMSATAMAAFYLGYRRICLVILSPIGGWIADKIGVNLLFMISISITVVGVVNMLLGNVEVGAVLVFSFYSIHTAIAPGSAVRGEPHPLSALAENATWRDLGAAIGTLIGGALINSSHLTAVLLLATMVLLVIVVIHFKTSIKPGKIMHMENILNEKLHR